MRRVLLVAYHYPPSRESGALRPRGLAKYLQEFGWNVDVLTPRLPGPRPGNVFETDYVDVVAQWKRRLRLHPTKGLRDQLNLSPPPSVRSRSLQADLIGAARWALTYPDPLKGWARFAVAALEQFRGRGIDAIISTAPPLVCHMVGMRAKQVLNCPWIADYRDLWNVEADTLEDQKGFVGTLQRRTERKVLAGCDALVSVSGPWAERLKQRYPSKPVHAITNGFDPDETRNDDCQLAPKFSITHTGMLYQGRRDPSALLETLRELIDAGQIDASDLLLRFYGPIEPFLQPLLKRYGLEAVTELRAAVPRPEVLALQRESQLLLILSWSGPNENGGHTGKVFEYLAARRPILAIGGARGVLTELLEETKSGLHVISKAQLRQFIVGAYSEYKRQGYVTDHGDITVIDKYSQREMSSRFADVLNQCVSAHSRTPAAEHTVAA
jgi:hypothetical protein